MVRKKTSEKEEKPRRARDLDLSRSNVLYFQKSYTLKKQKQNIERMKIIMAHLTHFKMADVKRLANEWMRDKNYKDKDNRIDHERTSLNYIMDDNYKAGRMKTKSPRTLLGVTRSRLNEVTHSTRKDLNVISCWVVTCPQELLEDKQKIKRFFEVVYDYCLSRYGEENVLNGYVHMDETSPHVHIPVIPIKDERVSSKALFTRKELSDFHKELDKLCEKEFKIKGLVLNGRTKGNYTFRELKERTAKENELNERETMLSNKETQLGTKETQLNEREIKLHTHKRNLDTRETSLKAREDVLEEDIKNYKADYEKLNITLSSVIKKYEEVMKDADEEYKEILKNKAEELQLKQTEELQNQQAEELKKAIEKRNRRRKSVAQFDDLVEAADKRQQDDYQCSR